MPSHPDPTPEEIAALCLGIQSGWSEHERRKRIIGYDPDEPFTVRVVKLDAETRNNIEDWDTAYSR